MRGSILTNATVHRTVAPGFDAPLGRAKAGVRFEPLFHSGRRGKRRSAACGGCSKPLSRQCPVWRTRMWPPDGWRNEGTAEEHAKVLFIAFNQRQSLLLGSARSRRSAPRHARGHQNVPPARFSRFARALFEPRPAICQKESPSFRMVFLFGAGDEARTRYLDLGKVALYQMSYARKRRIDYNPDLFVCQSCIFNFSSESQ